MRSSAQRRTNRVGRLCAALAFGFSLLLSNVAAQAGTPDSAHKLSRDLQQALSAAAAPGSTAPRWARQVGGRRQVQVIVTSSNPDPELAELRAEVLRLGGSVHARHALVQGLTVQLPAERLSQLAGRGDVLAITPNREVRRTSSALESAAGVLTPNVRTYATVLGITTGYNGLDGSGVGIAVLDSGVMRAHRSFEDRWGFSRVKRNVNLRNANLADWLVGVDSSVSPPPGSAALSAYESAIAADSGVSTQDPYGHGTHVAAVAAGRAWYQTPDTTGLAPGASVYDVRVLDIEGRGSLSDVLEGIQWVIFHAREYNIRVLNLSLAASSTDSWRTDPLCIAVRRATAAGITVVVAAGNFGLTAAKKETFGAISAPGNEPSVITVGSANSKGTGGRGDDVVNRFSSRGPTRGSVVVGGVRMVDNLLKPDLVAPGNRIVAAAATRANVLNPAWNKLALANPGLVAASDGRQYFEETLMSLSGTSIAAPAVAGAAALMLQANPGLTPPLIKAILQYTAQPLAGASLLQQGAGLLNVDGAVTLARALRTDIAGAAQAGSLSPGATLLAPGRAMPLPRSVMGGQTVNWSRIVYVGGNRVLSGPTLFQSWQPIWDPRITWAGNVVLRTQPTYWQGWGIPSNVFVKGFAESAAPNMALVTPAVVNAQPLLGPSSAAGRTGAFMPSSTLAAWLANGSGVLLASGMILSEGMVLSEGMILSEGIILSEGMILSEGIILSEGMILGEGLVFSETGAAPAMYLTDGALKGED